MSIQRTTATESTTTATTPVPTFSVISGAQVQHALQGREKDIVEIVFLWEAFDSSRQPSYIFRSAYDAKTLRPGEVQFKHEVDFKHSANVDTYRLSVRRVTFEDGTVWVAPQLTYD